MLYWTKSRGIGGSIITEEDFVVEEVLSRRMLKFHRTSAGVSASYGSNSLIKVRKKGMTTEEAVRKLSHASGISPERFHYAGLKDKFAVTTQYMTVKGKFSDVNTKHLSAEFVMSTDKELSKGDLEGNNFAITLHNCSGDPSDVVKEMHKRGMPNYFGPQRFGVLRNNHLIGELIAERKFSDALLMINDADSAAYRSMMDVPKEKKKFYLNAHQSFIFNEKLDEYVKNSEKPFRSSFRIPGFRLDELMLSCAGFARKAFVFPRIEYKASGNKVTLMFMLPKGSYATVLISEVTKV